MTTIKVTDASTEPVALDEAKRHLRGLADGDADPDISDMIKDARTACENRTQRSIMPTTWRLMLDAFPCVLRLQKPPVTAVTFVKYVDTNGVLQTLSAAAYLVDLTKEPAEISPAYGTSWPSTRVQSGAVQVEYVAGYIDASKVPGPLKRWIKLALTDLYENRGRSSDRPVVPQDFADELIDPYAMPVV